MYAICCLIVVSLFYFLPFLFVLDLLSPMALAPIKVQLILSVLDATSHPILPCCNATVSCLLLLTSGTHVALLDWVESTQMEMTSDIAHVDEPSNLVFALVA